MSDLIVSPAPPEGARHVAIVPAAGVGVRFGANRPKQYLSIGARTVLEWTVQALLASARFERVVVVVSPQDHHARGLAGLSDARVAVVPVGGTTRRDSVLAGLQWLIRHGLADARDWIWVHDAARPGLDDASIERLSVALASQTAGAVLATPVADTLRREASTASGMAGATEPREGLWQAQTPQVFRCAPLLQALERHPDVTDEAAAMQQEGADVRLVAGTRRNFKITTPDDLQAMAQLLLAGASEPIRAVDRDSAGMPWRIGQGWDVHALVPGRALILGGVTIPFDRGLLGHSDADVLLHAVTDALFGAAGLGDIGRHFPDTDPVFSGADSRVLLREAASRVCAAGWRIGNVDATIVAQSPRLAPHIPAMQANLRADLGLAEGCVNIKAKTSERLGFAGRGEGIEAHAAVLLRRA